jgi:L-ascorbate metabolism protein UlaG (beta-lactamase superfamily)
VHFRTVGTYHDDSQGSARGKNAIFVIEANDLHIVHLGDLGHVLTSEQAAAIGPVDVLLIPVGGVYTIDAAHATQVVELLKPRLVVPMHYKTPKVRFDLQPVDAFLSGKAVERVAGNQVTLSPQTLPQTTTVLVLGYE